MEKCFGRAGRPRVSDAKASEDGIKYFIARGSFASPSQIPAHYRYTDPEVPDAGASELERTYERKDYAFVVEHRWKERITNIVTLRGFIRGRDELLDVYLPVYTDAIEKIFSKDYDVARLVAWLRSDGRRFLENASLIVYDAAVRGRVLGKNNQFDGDLINGLYEEAERLGLDFKLLGEMFKLPADQERNERAAKVFVSRLVVRFFRHRDGSAVSAAEADELVRAMADGHRYADEFREESKRIEKSFEGNKEVAQRVRRAATRMVGVYSPIGFGAPEFEIRALASRRGHRDERDENEGRPGALEVLRLGVIPRGLRDVGAEHCNRSRRAKDGPRAGGYRRRDQGAGVHGPCRNRGCVAQGGSRAARDRRPRCAHAEQGSQLPGRSAGEKAGGSVVQGLGDRAANSLQMAQLDGMSNRSEEYHGPIVARFRWSHLARRSDNRSVAY